MVVSTLKTKKNFILGTAALFLISTSSFLTLAALGGYFWNDYFLKIALLMLSAATGIYLPQTPEFQKFVKEKKTLLFLVRIGFLALIIVLFLLGGKSDILTFALIMFSADTITSIAKSKNANNNQ
ncbi:hypothetical protein FZC78_15185 [Rossellomorea vietnamensis]|uniref:Uncharacterized protein n=1 Tax=Rossellomorea vietnamensis TaxID=218284 RepID=A0A5D4NR20_9BACI|nr:hypothetical protein [Rossellomorea vietnamensis]TYS15918.1 hypothetical protein FZC78_15185 [Rossellomorea vietnamensis]